MADEKLVRGIGRWDLTAIAINTIIGTGIFILPARTFGLIGSYSLLAFVACAIIVGLIVICFCEVSSRFNVTGGMYLYAKEAFGPEIGFQAGWLYWVVRVATFATNCNAMLLYISFFVDGANEGVAKFVIVTCVVIGITLINLRGVRETALATNIFTVGKIVPLLVFVLVGLFYVQPGNFNFDAVPTTSDFSAAVLVLIYAYAGFEAAVIPAGEIKDPEKNVPFALVTALVFIAILFILVQTVAIGTLPGLADSKTPIADAASGFLGAVGGGFIALGAMISVLGNLNGGFLATSRIPFAMAEQRELPAVFGKTHKTYKTPYVSILVTAAVILVLTVYSSFLTALTIATVTRLLVYASTCLALPVFRERKDLPRARYTAPIGILAAVLSLALIGWLLTNVDFSREGLPIIAALIAGSLIFYAYRLFAKRDRGSIEAAED